MGTQIHSKRYSTGYCSIWGLDMNASNDIWSQYREDIAPKTGQYGDSLLPQHMTIIGSLEYKEKVRQTILKHESIFRHQLQELHRLYGRQKELMNVFRRIDEKKGQTKAVTTNSSPLSSNIPSEDAKPTQHAAHSPSLHLLFGQSSTSESSSKKSFSGFSKDKSMLAFPSMCDGSSEICEPQHSNRYLLRRRIIDLEIPSDVNINHEEIHLKERFSGLSGVESYSAFSMNEILRGRDIKSSLFSDPSYHQNGDALRSSLHFKRDNEVADLNEPILLEETSVSGSADNPGTITCTLDNRQRANVSATSNSILHPMWKETSLCAINEMNGGTCFNSLQSANERNRKQQLAHDFRAKLMRPDAHSVITDGYPRCLPVASQSSPAEQRKINEFSTSELGKNESKIKGKLFGVDIFEVQDKSFVSDTNMVKHTNFEELSCKPSFLQVKKSVDSSRRSLFSSSIDGISYQNGLSLCSQLKSKRSKGNSAVNCKFINNTTSALVHKVSQPTDLVNSVEGLECLGWRSANVIKTAKMTSDVFQDDIAPEHDILSADCQSEQKILKGSPVYLVETEYGPAQTRANKNSHHLNLDSLQKSSQQFFKTTKVTSLSSQILTDKQEPTLPLLIRENEERYTEVDEYSSTKMNCSFLTSKKVRISNGLRFATELTCLAADGDIDRDVKAEKVDSGDQAGGKVLNLEEPINSSLSCSRGHIDLNLSFIEEEAPSAPPSLPTAIVKLATTEIDLEVPMVLEPEAGKGTEMSSGGGKEPCEELIRLAAQAIIAISVSGGEDTVNDTTHDSLEATSNDCLKWFVDIVCSYECHDQSNMRVVNLSGDDIFTEELIPDGMDYFEYMTLKLKDAKSENYFYNCNAPSLENQDDGETKVTTLSRRPRRGQARRGRQRKDFQRDILPSLISLSKLEVTEDFQAFEELLRASGSTWESSSSRKSATKNVRGRRRSVVLPSFRKPDAISLPLEQKPVSRELELEDKTLSGWGKRTRRLPRQRFMSGATALPLNHS